MGKYEEALERAKEWEREHPNGYVIRDMMEFIFPGYNDSEDECTRKELIHFILYKAGQLLDEETEHKFVVYLGKQKEQESTESSENEKIRRAIGTALCGTTAESILDANGVKLTEALSYLEKKKEQKPVARENDFVSNPQTSVEILRHYLVWAGNSEEEDCPYTWKTLADAIRDGIKALEEQKPIFKKGDKVIWDGEEFNILDVDKDTYNVGGYIVPFSREGELHPIGWKPSEEQMEVFLKAVPVNLMPEELSVYKSLCDDIQKLM